MPDVAIVNQTVTGTPKDYTVPGSQELLVKAVRASIDGSAAGSAFLPALQLLDPAGHVMWTAVDTSTTVAAGGSADVSWFPGVNRSSGTASSTSGAVAYCQGATGVIPSGGSARVGFTAFRTTNTTIFGTDTTAVAVPPYHNTAGDTYLYGTATGFYLAIGETGWTVSANIISVLADDGGQWDLNVHGAVDTRTEVIDTTTPAGGVIGPASYRMFYVDAADTPLTTSILCGNQDAVGHTVLGATLAVYYLGTPTSLLAAVF